MTGCNHLWPAISKRVKYVILILFAVISINSAQNSPMKSKTVISKTLVPQSIDSIGRLIEANWDTIDDSRKDILTELSLLKKQIKNSKRKRPVIVMIDTVYVSDTVIIKKSLFDFLRPRDKKNMVIKNK